MANVQLGLKRAMVSKNKVSIAHLERRCSGFFLDSGGHSLYTIHEIVPKHVNDYGWYKSKEFVAYIDRYCEYVKANLDGIDHYAVVDVIFRPDLTWQVQKYMEDRHGLNPVPVLHYNTPLKWFDKYLEAGYDYLGVGGLGQEAPYAVYSKWADRVFDHICPGPSRLPAVRTHGFAMTSWRLLTKYPWWSVDSSSWCKGAGYGLLFVPHKRGGRFTIDEPPYMIFCSYRTKQKGKKGRTIETLSKGERAVVFEWLEKIGIPYGRVGENGEPVEKGVLTDYNSAARANLLFFQAMADALPPWPWPFRGRPKQGFW